MQSAPSSGGGSFLVAHKGGPVTDGSWSDLPADMRHGYWDGMTTEVNL